jgi:hypothetical protein
MWKIAVGFVVFAALALFVIFKAGDKVDMSGEKHGVDATHAPAPAASAAASAPMPVTSAAGPAPTASAAKP